MVLLRDRRFFSKQSQHSGGGVEYPSKSSALLSSLIPSDEVTAHQGIAHTLIPDGFYSARTCTCLCSCHMGVIFTGRNGDVAEETLSCSPAEVDGSVSHPPSAPQTGADG